MTSFDIKGLIEVDLVRKPSGADEEWRKATRYYEDQARPDTLARLRELGLGLKDNYRPLLVSLLRRMVDRIAVVYSRPPQRWLRRGMERLDESSPEHQLMLSTLARSQYDLAWRLADRTRANLRQCVLRYYPNDDLGRVVVRIFEPFNVLRDVSPSTADSMDSDRRFALRLQGEGRDAIFEYWEKVGPMQWRAGWCNANGQDLQGHPFTVTNGLSTYSQLPVQIVYDDFAGGKPWLPPRQSRVAWSETIDCATNDVWNLVVNEAHTRSYVKTDDPSQVPETHGPGVTEIIPSNADIGVLQSSAKIGESKDLITQLVRLWCFGEQLPISEFDDAKQVVTGASLRVESRPLLDRRADQVPLAQEDERTAWRKFRAVHNAHAPQWGAEQLDESTELEVEVAALEVPEDERVQLEADARAMAMGVRSTIDVIQRTHNATRSQATEIFARVKSDRAEYPAPVAVDATAPTQLPDNPDGRSSAQVPPMDVHAPDHVAPATPAAADPNIAQAAATQAVALNGAQVTSALEIVQAVATGTLPRESGISMLTAFFGLSLEVAERVMGPVGRGFTPAAPAIVPPVAQSA